MNLRSLDSSVVSGKTVLIRCDFNVPVENGVITDDSKIKKSLETINFCLKNKAKKIILCAHFGRPGGKTNKKLSLQPVAKHLSKLLKQEVVLTKSKDAINRVSMLENLRFHPGEKSNDPQLAKKLAGMADTYINEAFASSHREHASIVGVSKFLPSYAGFNLIQEVNHLEKLLENPKKPFVVIVGGAKISDKLPAIENLSKIADTILVGGAVANNFLKAEHFEVYKSYMEDAPANLKKEDLDFVKFADNLLDNNRQESRLINGFPIPKILYPIDVLAGKNPETNNHKTINLTTNNTKQSNESIMYLDIGPKTIKLYSQIIKQAKTIFWNGPMGLFENPEFAMGTKQVAQAIAKSKAYSVIGGGETIKAAHQFKLENKYSYVSSAGGAALEFLSGKMLPGIRPLVSNANKKTNS